MPHFWDANQNGWVNPNTGFVLSEQQVQEMAYMMYSEDSYDLPKPHVQEATSGTGTWKSPAKPPHYTKDYNTLVIEAVGAGGAGGSASGSPKSGDLDPWGNGGGAGAYAKQVITFSNADRSGAGITVGYFINPSGAGIQGVTVGVTGPVASVGGGYTLTALNGFDGTTGNRLAATGGTAAILPIDAAGTTLQGPSGLSGSLVAGGKGAVPNLLLSIDTIGEREEFNKVGGGGASTILRDGAIVGTQPGVGTFGGGGGGGITATIEGGVGVSAGATGCVPLARATWMYIGG